MYNILGSFVPSDVPGDPELGGWRPIPSSYYRNLSAIHNTGLWQALQYLGFELRYSKLKRAMEVIANKLRQE